MSHRAACLLRAVVALFGLLAPVVARADAQCLYAETPPDPPDKGAVLWSPPAPGSTAPNTLIIGFADSWDADTSGNCASATAQQPRVISVAKGAAVQFYCSGEIFPDCVSPWGAVNVGLNDPPPVLNPSGNPDFQVGIVSVMAPADALGFGASCRQCDFSGVTATFSPLSDYGDSGFLVGFALDVTGANFQGATITGDATDYDFSGADLSGAVVSNINLTGAHFNNKATLIGTTFNEATLVSANFDSAFIASVSFAGLNMASASFFNTVVDDTVFGGAKLQGVTFSSLQFVRTPPSFAGATFDGCTQFVDTSLFGVSFAAAAWESNPGCAVPSFPGSQLPLVGVQQLLAGAKGVGIDWTGAQVVASAEDRGALAGADLSGANFANLVFLGESLDLSGTNLNNANLTGTDLTLARLAGASFQNVTAPGAVFESTDLSSDGTQAAASFAGANTHLEGASFVNATISGASFIGAHLDNALFGGARGVSTDFSGVSAAGANFARAHLYGKGDAFDSATDLQNVDFSEAVLAGNVSENGGFDLTGAALSGARFDGTVCVNCNFTNAILTPGSPGSPSASFVGAYLPGVQLAGAELAAADFEGAWLYCGDANNTACPAAGSQRWNWPLALGSGEVYGPVPFGVTDVADVSLADVGACPSGKPGATAPAGCTGNLLPTPAVAPPLPAPCSASGRGACPSLTATVFDATKIGKPLALAAAAPPTWNTPLLQDNYLIALDDHTLRQLGEEAPVILAGQAGQACGSATAPCGDGGPAAASLLGTPSAVAVGLDGSVYIADTSLRRVRSIAPLGGIAAVAGTGVACAAPPCGDGGPATAASLTAANGVAVDTHGVLLIADGAAGVRRVGTDGTITTLAPGSATGNVVSVVQDADGRIFAATSEPDGIIQIDATSGTVTPVVGTGTSGYNGNSEFGLLIPGTSVQVNQPRGLAVNLDGNVLFADSGNHLIRAYVPSTGYVIDDLAGVVTNGVPQGGFNGDGNWANATELNGPLGVAATRSSMLVVADTGNQRVRQVGPAPLKALTEPPRPISRLHCRFFGRIGQCRREVVKLQAVSATVGIPVTIRNYGRMFATGRKVATSRPGWLRFIVTEEQPLVPGRYRLIKRLPGGPRHFRVDIR